MSTYKRSIAVSHLADAACGPQGGRLPDVIRGPQWRPLQLVSHERQKAEMIAQLKARAQLLGSALGSADNLPGSV